MSTMLMISSNDSFSFSGGAVGTASGPGFYSTYDENLRWGADSPLAVEDLRSKA